MDAGETGEEQEIEVNYILNEISFTEAHEVEDKEVLYTEIAKHTSMDVSFITNLHTFVTQVFTEPGKVSQLPQDMG